MKNHLRLCNTVSVELNAAGRLDWQTWETHESGVGSTWVRIDGDSAFALLWQAVLSGLELGELDKNEPHRHAALSYGGSLVVDHFLAHGQKSAKALVRKMLTESTIPEPTELEAEAFDRGISVEELSAGTATA